MADESSYWGKYQPPVFSPRHKTLTLSDPMQHFDQPKIMSPTFDGNEVDLLYGNNAKRTVRSAEIVQTVRSSPYEFQYLEKTKIDNRTEIIDPRKILNISVHPA